MPKLYSLLLTFSVFAFCVFAPRCDSTLFGQDAKAVGVTVPEGFTITQVADDSLATDIFSMTLTPLNEPVVSGRGYIKILHDRDKDGIYETSTAPFKGPRSGAQGMLFESESQSLRFVGDGALWNYTGGEGPVKVMPTTTGAEHTAHALRRGPDGWLYLLAGNATKILPEYFDGPNSPVKKPEQGFLMRISPDGKTREIVAHGFRNAYDFDFNSDGQVFVYDSDGERQVSLPWYQGCLLYTSPSPRDATLSRMPSSA